MPKYLLLSLPLLAAAIVGLIVFFITLSMQHYSSMEEIRKAPSWKASKNVLEGGETEEDKKSYEESVHVIKDSDDEDTKPEVTPAPEMPAPKTKGRYRQKVLLDSTAVWREKLEKERYNAFLKARKAGVIAAMITTVLGYILLGAHFYTKNRSSQTWRDVVATAPPAPAMAAPTPSSVMAAPQSAPVRTGPPPLPPGRAADAPAGAAFTEFDLKFDEGPSAPAAPAPAQPAAPAVEAAPAAPPNLSPNEGPYEPYEAPVDISELDKNWEEQRKFEGRG